LRDYVAGDDRRAIDWRGSARARHLVVRTWQPERDRALLIVIDCGRLSAARIGDYTRLQKYLDATLMLTALAVHAGETVEILAFNTGPVRQAWTKNREGALASVGSTLTGLSPRMVETNYPAMARDIVRRTHSRHSVVVLTALGAEDAAEDLGVGLAPVAAHTQVLLADVESSKAPMTSDAAVNVYRAAARVKSELALQQTQAQLGHRRLKTLTASSDEFASRLADSYLRSRGIM
jgi:uncharacterized protein (DUF58 family)